MRLTPLFAGTVVLALESAALGAQTLRGTVRDSTSGLPIAGAVVSFLDGTRAVAGRTITDERGQYHATLSDTGARSLRVIRLGFRPVDLPIPSMRPEGITLDVVMTRIPFHLQPVQVVAARGCPRRAGRTTALALLEQARAGLLATVVARSEKPAMMKRLAIERRLDPEHDSVLQHVVRIDSVGSAIAAYRAAYGGPDFVKRGFATDVGDQRIYFAPDADVLLDDGFAAGYCFHVMEAVGTRPNQVGLGFAAAERRQDRVDVEGALWIDTVARSLVDIEFRYAGLDPRFEELRPGGHVEFREMANGVVLLDRWMLRLAGAHTDSGNLVVRRERDRAQYSRTRFLLSEVGGELARASWPDGYTWSASLGTLALSVVTDSGTPSIGTTVRLEGTDYAATTDSAGRLRISDLAPGPYSVVVANPSLDVVSVELKTALAFSAARGETKLMTLRTKSAPQYVAQWCRAAGLAVNGDSFLFGRVTDAAGVALSDVRVTLRMLVNGLDLGTALQHARLAEDGLFGFCGGWRQAIAKLTFSKRGMRAETVTWPLANPLTVIPVQMVPDR